MSKAILHRPARVMPPVVPDGPITVPLPPEPPQGMGFSWWPQLLFPLVTSCGSLYFIVYNPNPTYIAISLVMTGASVALSLAMVAQQVTASRRRWAVERRRYLAYLLEVARRARRTAELQDAAARFVHPGPAERWAVACGRVRVWERRPRHEDFLSARVGLGRAPLATPLILEGAHEPLVERDPELLAAAERVVAEHREVPDHPVVLDLRRHPVVSVIGAPEQTRAVARSILTELATFCAPDELLLAVLHPPGAGLAWGFVRWLPHQVGEGGRALCGEASEVLEPLMEEVGRRREAAKRRETRRGDDEPCPRQMVVVVDGFSAASPLARLEVLGELTERARELGASLLFLVENQRDEPPTVDLRVRIGADGDLRVEDDRGNARSGRADRSDPCLAEAIARHLAPLRLGDRDDGTVLGETCRLMELLGVGSARALDPAALWGARPERDLLRVPIGVGADGAPVLLDLKEAARGGMGPHGLVVGATGSGKSELLRTLVTGLAVTHPPETLGFVLVDFKGGAAFAGLAELPHVAGMITNLADDVAMVDRTYAALFGEMQRRQSLLRRAGNLDSVREYQQRRAAGRLPGSEPLPYLVIVVDEFGELLASRPDFIELFVAIGRVGRSIGMHLLLASQRLEEGRLRGLESHLSYRICLRTFTPAESQSVLGTQDAYRLPAIPGSAYLKVHTDVYERFRAALVSAPEPPAEEAEEAPSPLFAHGLTSYGAAGTARALPPAEEPATEMAIAVERVRGVGAQPVHQVWLPPLPSELGLERLLPPLGRHPRRGLQALGWPHLGQARAPVGLLDEPLAQAQRPFILDFAGWAGHLIVVGAPQTGKSTFLRTLVLALIATHTPDEARIYIVDYGGGTLGALAHAPHVGDVAGRLEVEKVRRTVGEVWALVDERETRLRELGIDSPEALRRRRAEGAVPPELGSDVFLLVDGWGAVREELEDLEAQLREIAARGLRVGCHLVLTANRWHEIRPNLRDNIGGRLELRLNDAAESEIDRRAALSIPVDVPGRALCSDSTLLQIALPQLGGRAEEVAAAAAAAWRGHPAPAVRLLPARVVPRDLPAPGHDLLPGVPIGVEELELAPVYLDLSGADAHFLVFGDAESGKTTFLRSWMAGLQARQGPDRAMLLVIDYRRTLLGAARPEQLWAYCGAAPQAAAAVQELATGIVERLPAPTLSAEAIAARSWWTGPDFYVVVDDYDLVASPAGNPLASLIELLAQGRDLGLHVILARRVGGMARGGMDPFLSRLRELQVPGLIMSGDPGEGPILGLHRAAPQPPGRGLLVRRRHRPVRVQTVDATLPPD
ncbi:MAG TPA: type VII secretion protein EccCb [Candidatus Dormibacteraeota bacterium]|nr:type VII secretion protein EccCb [Candidatus Dormibacteraeota bacterium]